mgnify:CR=1 FL=1
MGFFSSIAKSVVKGGLVKGAIKAVGKGIKTGAGKVVKGLKSTAPKIIRGIKSGTAQVRALPKAVKEAVSISAKLPKGFGASNTMRVAINKISQNLSKASKTALSKDSVERLSSKLAKALTDKKQSKVLKNILKNARKNETWKSYLGRNVNVGKDWIKSSVRGSAENVAIDKSISIAGRALAGVATTGASVGAGVAISKSTN